MRDILDTRRRELLEGVATANGDREEQPENLPDLADVAATESDQSFSIRLKERELKLVSKIDEALDRITGGTYGICEACGEPISPGRLRARPVTTLCIACKTEQEARESREDR